MVLRSSFKKILIITKNLKEIEKKILPISEKPKFLFLIIGRHKVVQKLHFLLQGKKASKATAVLML